MTALLAGDHSAATEVRPVLPDAGVCSTTIVNDVSLEKHATFMARLQQAQGRKHGFWGFVLGCARLFLLGLLTSEEI